MPKLTVARQPLQFRQDMPITPPQSTIPHLDIGIATHHNWLDLMQQLPMVTMKMCPRNLRRFWQWQPWPKTWLQPWPGPGPRSRAWIWPQPKHNKGNLIKSLSEAIKSLTESVHKDPSDSKAKIRDPNTFDGSDSKKLRGFLLQCKLNFWSKPKSFQTKQLKVNYSLSFLKGTTLDYFKLYVANDPENEPTWLNDYELFIEELLINFGPYDMMVLGNS